MMNAHLAVSLLLLTLGIAATGTAFAEPAGARAWKVNRLLNPTDADRVSEAKGRVMIYSGLTDKDVERALDRHFDRIEHMMFVRTVVTDDAGEAQREPESGRAIVESDGCD